MFWTPLFLGVIKNKNNAGRNWTHFYANLTGLPPLDMHMPNRSASA